MSDLHGVQQPPHCSEKPSSRSSHEFEPEHFPTDLLSSTKHDDLDGSFDQAATESDKRRNEDIQFIQIPKVTSTGSMDMVSGEAVKQQNKDFSVELDTSLKDIEYDGSKQKHPRCCGVCCLRCKLCCRMCCYRCSVRHNPLSGDATRCQKFKYAFLCPPHGWLGNILTYLTAVLLFWLTLWALTGDEALPGGNLFAILTLLVCCSIGGFLVSFLRLPPLLGMLLVGFVLRNVPVINVAKYVEPEWSSALRNIALVVILVRAGLGLDPVALKKLSFGVFRLAFVPCLVEALTAMLASHFILGLPWIWGLMLGFVLGAVSPAVVVPSMLSLQEQHIGTDKGIPTLVIAAASVDDVLAISGFGVVLGIAFSTGNLVLTIFRGPLEALGGVVYGILFGVLCWYLPPQKHPNQQMLRSFILLFAGLVATFGSRALDISGAGALGCLTVAFIAAISWRKEDTYNEEKGVNSHMAALWVIFQPLLFGLIGAEVDVMQLKPTTIGLGIAVLCIGLITRCVVAFLVAFRLGLNWKEKFFIPVAWLPKATVQAAIGSVALDTARAQDPINDEFVQIGTTILTMAVLSILITAPIGAAAIAKSAPRLLHATPVKSSWTSEPAGDTEPSDAQCDGKNEDEIGLTFLAKPKGH